MRVKWDTYESPIGPLAIVEAAAGPLVIEFPPRTPRIQWAVRLRGALPEVAVEQGPCDVTRRRVARFAAQQKLDPEALQVLETNVGAEDTFVVEPSTCLFHDGLLTEQGRVVLQGPSGGRAEVLIASRDTSRAEYPVKP